MCAVEANGGGRAVVMEIRLMCDGAMVSAPLSDDSHTGLHCHCLPQPYSSASNHFCLKPNALEIQSQYDCDPYPNPNVFGVQIMCCTSDGHYVYLAS